MNIELSNIQRLKEMLVYELTKALGLPQTSSARSVIRGLFGRATEKFSELALGLDGAVGEGGVSVGANWVLPRFVKSHIARGIENIPTEGPLLIAANHPGSYDSIVISAHVTRPDYKIIIGDIPFFQNLPNISKNAIFAPAVTNVVGRMRTVRETIRHLEKGGALLIFPRGSIEADPAFMPSPGEEFQRWSRSLEIFLRRVPQTQVLTTIVSGVIAKTAFRHPITWFRKARSDRQRLAFMYQMVRQVLSGREIFGLTPQVTFGELLVGKNPNQVVDKIAGAAQYTLERHLGWQI
jgi:hypothetical protein